MPLENLETSERVEPILLSLSSPMPRVAKILERLEMARLKVNDVFRLMR